MQGAFLLDGVSAQARRLAIFASALAAAFFLLSAGGAGAAETAKAALAGVEWLRGAEADWPLGDGRTACAVVFWTPWNPASVPALKRLEQTRAAAARENDRPSVAFAAVACGSDSALARRFLAELPFPVSFAVAADANGAAEQRWLAPLGISAESLPYAFLAGPSGAIEWRGAAQGPGFAAALERLAGLNDPRAALGDASATSSTLLGAYFRAVKEPEPDRETARALGERILAAAGADAEALARFAAAILDSPEIQWRDTELALRAAQAAHDAAPGESMTLFAYGWALRASGRGEEAAPLLEAARDAESSGALRAKIEAALGAP